MAASSGAFRRSVASNCGRKLTPARARSPALNRRRARPPCAARVAGTCEGGRRGPPFLRRLGPASTNSCRASGIARQHGGHTCADGHGQAALNAGICIPGVVPARSLDVAARCRRRPPAASAHCARASRRASFRQVARPNIAARPVCNGHQPGQLAVDIDVAGRENVRDDFRMRQGRPPQPRQPFDQRPGRIERRAGKRAEAGDEDGGHYIYFPVIPRRGR
jgi:hypothetical protein